MIHYSEFNNQKLEAKKNSYKTRENLFCGTTRYRETSMSACVTCSQSLEIGRAHV